MQLPSSFSTRLGDSGLSVSPWLPLGVACLSLTVAPLSAQSTFQETFTGSSAYGWSFGGTGYTPSLTAATGIDTVGNGWLRLTDNGTNRSTYALLDT